MRYIILDLESHAIADAATYLTEPVEAPANYKDEAKIASYVASAKQAQLDKAAAGHRLGSGLSACLGLADGI